ncbi:hypothetical protein AB0M80_40445 [Amycolatopsis sp. NPDC051045]|uniref:hypothetical protein n=1 Tax=Amycolatopsis sp. NPDC051045 TaxID=3156922 RepID=UPI0034247DC1
MAPAVTGRRRLAAVAAAFLALAGAACAPACDRDATAPSRTPKAQGIAVHGRLTTPVGELPDVRETGGLSGTGPGTHG